jgi:hypothetical protein
MTSLFAIFKIGPSNSHTAGPMAAAKRFKAFKQAASSRSSRVSASIYLPRSPIRQKVFNVEEYLRRRGAVSLVSILLAVITSREGGLRANEIGNKSVRIDFV